jgi:hypothetical protein
MEPHPTRCDRIERRVRAVAAFGIREIRVVTWIEGVAARQIIFDGRE